jgi:hypothetical protein
VRSTDRWTLALGQLQAEYSRSTKCTAPKTLRNNGMMRGVRALEPTKSNAA